MNDHDLPLGCVIVIILLLVASGIYFMAGEVARYWVWIKWAFQ